MALMIDPIDVYVFRSGCFARNGDSVVCVGPRHAIEALLGQGAVSRLFFGYALYRDEGGADLIGVWGRRNGSRLRRLLREQGAELLVHHTPPYPTTTGTPAFSGDERRQTSCRKAARRTA